MMGLDYLQINSLREQLKQIGEINGENYEQKQYLKNSPNADIQKNYTCSKTNFRPDCAFR